MRKNDANLQVTASNVLRLATLTIIVALLIIPVKIYSQGAKTDFSGTWTFNESKSNLGEGRGFRSASQITITQDGINLTAVRQRTNQDGDLTSTTEKYTMDGKECVNTTGRGPSKSIVTWSADGKTLNFATTRTFERDGETNEIKSTEVWTLADTKTLSVISTFVMQGNERKTTLIYDKK